MMRSIFLRVFFFVVLSGPSAMMITPMTTRRSLLTTTALATVSPGITKADDAKAALIESLGNEMKPLTNVTARNAVVIEARARALEAFEVVDVAKLDGNWRLRYSNAREITSLESLPFLDLARVDQPFDLRRGVFENQGLISPIGARTRVVGEFVPSSSPKNFFDVVFRRVIFECGPLSKIVEPRVVDPKFRPGITLTYLDDDLRVTRGADGSLFILQRDLPARELLSNDERTALYGGTTDDIVTAGAGLENWARSSLRAFFRLAPPPPK